MTTKLVRGIGHLVRALRAHDAEGCSDGQLLERFLGHQDEAAFAALVRRHGPMVFGVCRRVLGNDADSEDAFQATFLVLVRKAHSLRARAILGDWLHGVARYTALKAKAAAAHRRAKEQVMARPDTTAEEVRNDWLPFLDEELARLPEKYRLPIVLCDLEGKTRREAADQLGWPEGTVAGRLIRARSTLAKRLARHGVVFSGGALAVALSQNATSACMPASMVPSTIKTATLFAAGQAGVSPHVVALTQTVLKTMLLNKLKTVMTGLFVVLSMMVGGAWLRLEAEVPQGAADKSRAVAGKGDEKEKEQATALADRQDPKENDGTAWGEEMGGLQAGLCLSNPNDIRIGENARAIVKLRNVSKEAIFVSAWPVWLSGLPRVVDASGKPVRTTTPPPRAGIKIDPELVTLKPGQTVELDRIDVVVAESDQRVNAPEGVIDFLAIHVRPGKHRGNCVGFLKEHPTLATGTVDFEVKPARDKNVPTNEMSDADRLQGKWVSIACEMNGKELTANELKDFHFDMSFQRNEYAIRFGAIRMTGKFGSDGAIDMKGRFELDPNGSPKKITLNDAEGSQNAGIYRFEGDLLRICIVDSRQDGIRPTEFKTKAGSGHSLILFKRAP